MNMYMYIIWKMKQKKTTTCIALEMKIMKYRLHRHHKPRTDCHSYHLSLHSKSCRDFKIIWFLSIWFSSSSSCNLNIRYLNDKRIIMTISLLSTPDIGVTSEVLHIRQILHKCCLTTATRNTLRYCNGKKFHKKTCWVEHNYKKNSNPKFE